MDPEKKEISPELRLAYKRFVGHWHDTYLAKFPRLRESEIGVKVLREWDAMTHAKKLAQAEICAPMFESESESDSPRRKSKSPSQPLNGPSNVRVFISKPSIRSFDENAMKIFGENVESYILLNTVPESDQSEDVEDIVVVLRDPKKEAFKHDKELQEAEKINYYCKKLQKDHPNWTIAQCVEIAKLMEKKQKIKKTAKREKKAQKLGPMKTFIAHFGHGQLQGKALWRALPRESKIYWVNQANKGIVGEVGTVKLPSVFNLKFMLKKELLFGEQEIDHSHDQQLMQQFEDRLRGQTPHDRGEFVESLEKAQELFDGMTKHPLSFLNRK